MNSYYPGPYYSPSFVPPMPQNTEKKDLRRTATFVGLMMLLLTATMQFTYPVVALLLMSFGYLPQDALMQDELGLGNTQFLVIYGCVYTLAMGLPLLLAIPYHRLFTKKYAYKPMSFGINFFAVLGAVGGCMGANIITSYILTILYEFGVPIPESPQMMEHTPISLLLNLFIVAVLPALLEEAVFRGCVLRSLRPYGDGFALVVSAVLFGLMHGNIRQIPFATIVGLVLGWLYVSTNSIWMPMLIHFINNALSVCMEYFSDGYTDTRANVFYAAIVYGLAIVGGVAVLIVMSRRGTQLRMEKCDSTLRFGEKIGALFKSAAFIIALCIFVILTGLELMA